MKTPHLLASFAVAATVSAADLKDPAQVAREWNEAVAQSAPPAWTSDLSLRGTTAISEQPARTYGQLPKPIRRTQPKAAPRERLYDAPGYRIPETLPQDMPPGSKPWQYGGQTYWLMPLIPSREK
jgi:hypothetical protein